ncbi:NF041680 family putative transposase [Dactylosporangium sp. NPDC005555]|uniref:NF041680 family putative transposase n=1 Tax=Dactylosporangium sp. NPDC005555 TaxID=3154889 RepID=UPI0033B0EC93
MPGLRAVSASDPAACREALVGFRLALYRCFGRRADALFELVDAVLTADGPVSSLVELSLEKAFRRGHGALYDALACGEVDVAALTALVAASWEPADDGPVKVAVDVSAWPRPDAVTSAGLCHCYTSCRCDGARKTIPGWPFSFAAGLEWGASSWTALLDAVRIGPQDDATVVTVAQIGAVVARLAAAGSLAGRPAPLFVFDSGYDLTRITFLAADHGVQVLGRVRSDRVFYAPAPKRLRDGRPGRPRLHGNRFELSAPASLPPAEQQLSAQSPRYGAVVVSAWHGLHQRLCKQAGWTGFVGPLPVVPGTVIRIQVERLPGNRAPQDLWLWHTAPPGTVFDLDLLWKTYLRRFDLEHTFRLLKGMLGWTAPQIRTPEQGQRWTWLVLAAHTQLRLARTLTIDLRRRWEKSTPIQRPTTPGRVRRGFRMLRRHLGTPARTPKSTTAGPGRPTGTTRPPRTRYDVGKKKSTVDNKQTRKRQVRG